MKRRCVLAVLLPGLLLAAPALPAAEVGRLFLTPAERAQLDALRAAATAPAHAATEPPPADAPAIDSQPITVNGVVRRSDGVSTIWVNGISSYDGEVQRLPAAVDRAGLQQGRAEIRAPDGSRAVLLKPGQSFDPASGAVTDLTTADPQP